MEKDIRCARGKRHWAGEYRKLQTAIADKIREYSSNAEAHDFTTKGNIDKKVGPQIPRHQLYIDMCIRDLDYISEFVKQHSRGVRG
jgi:hypothetical protein